ncbi:MAG: DNA methylase [Candidatus Rokubacteria bacterium RIFCSPLOWO2_02_FULL_72_37]|nr:MAG: DNA methylase [Candidatus Rokubacteria bacterium RIFCSPLOWO2_02_FULL_72_37]
MAKARPKKAGKGRVGEPPKVYEHKEEKLLLRPDVGLQPQFKAKKPPKTYRYDPSLDPALSWDTNPARERGEALIAKIEGAKDLAEAKTAAAELKRMSRPFLDWAGKAERQELTVPTLPLFVHERLSTQAILQSVKSHKRDRQQSLALFADEELDVADRLLKAYEHPTPWVNRLILGDSLVVMNSLLQYEGLGGQVQTIYMDPPYGVRFGSNFQPFVRKRDVKHGDDTDFTREPETVQAYRDTWELGLHSYLSYLRDRLLLCRELLAPSGSIFVQISDENLHHLRELLDEVFGADNFVVVVCYRRLGMMVGETIQSSAHYLLWYAKNKTQMKSRKLFERQLPGRDAGDHYVNLEETTTRHVRPLTQEERANSDLIPVGWRPFQLISLTTGGFRPNTTIPYEFEGKTYHPGPNKCWRTTKEGLDRLVAQRRIVRAGGTIRYKQFLDDFPLTEVTTIWQDTARDPENLYVVQTPSNVVRRCILMTTDPGDLVLDPTCGSGTTAYVAEQWGRRWIAVDTSRVPLALARQRLLTATFPYYELREPGRGPIGGFEYLRRQNQKGEEVGGIVPHITLRSTAQNELPEEEVLVDRPEVASGVVRVAGPFVVEATIPTAVEVEPPSAREVERDYVADPVSRMIEVLRRSATLRVGGRQAVVLKNVRRPAKALSLHAEAEVEGNGTKPVAFVFGPEHGPVTEQLVFAAAREANLKSYAHLYVVGFAIQPGASRLIQACEEMVGLPATYVQATMDLLMGDLLKTTRASQIFSVTGAPDVRLVRLKRKNGNGRLYRVELLGLDVFDPVTMQNDHRKGDDVPAWLLDSDYDDLVFRASQVFFPRTSAWDALKRALKATYEESVWEHLAGTVSEPFAEGDHRRVAIKVIDDRGNELMVVKGLDEAEPER